MTTSSITAPTNVAVLGLGAMGSRLASNLVAAGHRVTVWNRSRGPAVELAGRVDVTVATSPAEAAREADVVISMVRDDEASRAVWLDPVDGALGALAAGTGGAAGAAVAVESSTVSPAHAVRLGAAAQEVGVPFLEAPVVGSRPQADAGALLTLVGGAGADLERVRPVLAASAGRVHHVGPVGQAAVVKLAINGLFAIQVAAYAEVVGLLQRSEVDSAATLALLADLPITSPGLQRILGLIADRAFEPNFPVHLVAKDLDYLDATAGALGADAPLSAATLALFRQGATGPERDLDIAGIAARYLPATG